MTVEIFVHRALFNKNENSIEGILNWTKNNFNLELDLRYDELVYLSHDKTYSNELFKDACKIFKNSKSIISLHVKEFSAILPTIKLIEEFSLYHNSFLFMTDFNYQNLKHLAINNIEIGYYASHLPSFSGSKYYWCDEIQSKWYTKKILEDLHSHNFFCIAMSPELTKQTNKQEIQSEWERLINLNFDGICTDLPLELKDFMEKISI
jgi:hypothetical protein